MTKNPPTPAAAASVARIAAATKSWLVVVVLFSLVAVHRSESFTVLPSIHKAGLISEEFCQSDIFNPSCYHRNGVILILTARLGRMRPGRCITGSYGHLGCSSDVTVVLGIRCNGRPSCSMHVTDDDLHSTLTCPRDLASFLEVKYVCLGLGYWYNNTTSCPRNSSLHISLLLSSTELSNAGDKRRRRRRQGSCRHHHRCHDVTFKTKIRRSGHHLGNGSFVAFKGRQGDDDVSHVAYLHLGSSSSGVKSEPEFSGHLSSHFAARFGSVECPFQFTAPHGWRIRFTLVSFGGLLAALSNRKIEVRQRGLPGSDRGDQERGGFRCYYVASVLEELNEKMERWKGGCQVDVCVGNTAGIMNREILLIPNRYKDSTLNYSLERRTNTTSQGPNDRPILYSSSKNSLQFFFANPPSSTRSDEDDDDQQNGDRWPILVHYQAHSCSQDTREASDTLHCSHAKGETPPTGSNLDSGFSKVDESAPTDKESHSIPIGLLLVVAIGVSLGVFTGGLLLSILSVVARSNRKKDKRSQDKDLKLDDRPPNEDDFLSLERRVTSGKMAATSVDHIRFLIDDRHLDGSCKMAAASSSSSSSTWYRTNPAGVDSGFHVFPVTCDYVTDGRVVASLGDVAVKTEKRESRDSIKATVLMTSGHSRCSYCFPDVLH